MQKRTSAKDSCFLWNEIRSSIAVKTTKPQSLRSKKVSQQELLASSFTLDEPLYQSVQQNTFKPGKWL